MHNNSIRFIGYLALFSAGIIASEANFTEESVWTLVDAARQGDLSHAEKPGILELARNGSEDERYWAMVALARSGLDEGEAVEVVLRAMQDSSFRVRSAGAWAAGYLGITDPQVLASLGRLLRDHNEVPRSAAATALNAYGDDGIVLLEEVLESGTMGQKLNALSGLRATPEGLRNERYRVAQRALFPDILAYTFPDPDPTINRLKNNDFEVPSANGEMPGWELVLEGGAKGYAEVDTNRSRSGGQSLKMVRQNALGFLYLRSVDPVVVPAGESFTMRGYFKADTAPLNNVLLFRFEREDGRVVPGEAHRGHAFQSQTLLRNSPEGHWDKRMGDYTAGDEDEKIRVRIYLQGNPADVWLDDLSFPASRYAYTYSGPVRTFSPATHRELIVSEARATNKITAVLGERDSGGVLLKNNEKVAPVLYFSQRPDFADNDGMANYAGVPFVISMVPITDRVDQRYPVNFPVWTETGYHDFTTPLEHLALTAEAAPDAGIILNFNVIWPSDWVELNPDHAWLDASGRRGYGMAGHFRGFGEDLPPGHRWWPSPYSTPALEDAAGIIRAFLGEVRDSPYADRVVGCFISGGHDGQFFTANWPDHSPTGVRAFRDWLRKRYGDDDGLRKAWHRPHASLDTVEIPYMSVRPNHPETLSFLDPTEHQDVVDYRRFSSEQGMVIKEYFARVFKDEMGDDTLAMTWQMGGGRGDGTHSVFLKSDVLDILIPQPSYELRIPGYYGGLSAPLASYNLHGKLAVKELDLRTWLRSGGAEVFNQRLGAAMTPEWWRNVNRKEIGQMIAAGHGYWYYDIGGTHFRDLDMLDEIKATRLIADELVRQDAANFKPDVAVIVSEGSQYWGYPTRRGRAGWLTLQNYAFKSLKTSGVPYAEYFLEDMLTHKAVADHRVVVFLDAWRLTDEERTYIASKLKGDGRTLVWIYAPGFISDAGPSTAALSEMVGMRVETKPAFARTDAYWSDEEDVFSAGMYGLQGMGESFRAMHTLAEGPHRLFDVQRFYINDPEASVLARYRDGEAAIAVRRFPDWTSVYVAAPAGLQARLLNNIAREAGAYVLTEPGQAIEMNKNFISIHGMRNAEHRLQLPFTATVRSLDTGETITENVDAFTLSVEAQNQYWFSLQPHNNTKNKP